jgi:hypothetical protein
MLKLEFEPFDVIVTVPLADPLVLGAKTTVNEVLCPAVKFKGKLRPLKLKPLPLAIAAEIVRLDPPLLVSVSDKLELLPTCTVPNARLVGFAASVPGTTPVPESGMLSVELDASETMLSDPLAEPALPGAKIAVKLTL